ncbi:MAG: thermonuclease family protein [Vampirovibrionales bacterium]|nr:thermonuclease family protein [Vampirovibrionales bacterium]
MRKLKGLVIALYLAMASFCYAQGLPRESVTLLRVVDGDTIELIYHGKREKLRLEGIDAPEESQGVWGQRATTYLQDQLNEKQIFVQITGRDKYKRLLGYIYAEDKDINQALVANGYSYAYLKYSFEFETEEEQAKSQCLGFWCKKDQPLYPWVYRHPELKLGNLKG